MHDRLEDAYDEMELFGFTVSLTAFEMLQDERPHGLLATQMEQHIGREVSMTGHLVTIKYVRTIKGEIMHFAAFLDIHGQFFDTVHFPQIARDFPFRGNGVYRMSGRLVEEFGFPLLEVSRMEKLPLRPDPRYEGEPVSLSQGRLNSKHTGRWNNLDPAREAVA